MIWKLPEVFSRVQADSQINQELLESEISLYLSLSFESPVDPADPWSGIPHPITPFLTEAAATKGNINSNQASNVAALRVRCGGCAKMARIKSTNFPQCQTEASKALEQFLTNSTQGFLDCCACGYQREQIGSHRIDLWIQRLLLA